MLLVIHASLLAYGGKVHSPTVDEVAHLPAGISHWKFARLDLYKVNPPLVRLVAALPPMALGVETPWHNFSDHPNRRAEFTIGNDLIRANGVRSFQLFMWARWACIPFSLLGGWVVFRWSLQLFGLKSAFAALTMWCVSPNVLAHGQMITPDMAATSLGVFCCWRLWQWTSKPNWPNTLWFALALGLVELTKFTWIILVPLAIVLWAVKRFGASKDADQHASDNEDNESEFRRPGLLGRLARLCLAMLIAHQIILLGYCYDRVFQPLGDFDFVSETLRPNLQAGTGNIFAETWLAEIPVPLPACYVEGIDVQKREFEQTDRPSYLAGEIRYPGWWYYYLYGLAVKVPLGFWIIGAVAGCRLFWRRNETTSAATWRDQVFLLLPAILILFLVSSQTGINRHLRYVLPIFPFVFIWISQAFAVPSRRSIMLVVACVALAWATISSLWVYPHSLSYFNEVVGGPSNGHNHLINSNIDWGQDLLLLRKWVQEHPEQHDISIAYFGGMFPSAAELPGEPPPGGPASENLQPDMPRGPQPGWYAVSVNYLYRKFPRTLRTPDGRFIGVQADYAYFREFEPVETIGYSIRIYHISEAEAQTVRERIWQGVVQDDGLNGQTR